MHVCGCVCKAKGACVCDHVCMSEWAGGYKPVDMAKKSIFFHARFSCVQHLKFFTNVLYIVVETCVNVQNWSTGINILLRIPGCDKTIKENIYECEWLYHTVDKHKETSLHAAILRVRAWHHADASLIIKFFCVYLLVPSERLVLPWKTKRETGRPRERIPSKLSDNHSQTSVFSTAPCSSCSLLSQGCIQLSFTQDAWQHQHIYLWLKKSNLRIMWPLSVEQHKNCF